jgi:hypothetical protein
MILKSFGCSFIFGTDLADDGRHLPTPTSSNFTWPALLAKNFNYHYECYARPGSGNLQIAERVLSHINNGATNCDYFIIGWTWIDRFDYTNSTINTNPIASRWNNWKTLMPIDSDFLAETYYKGLHSEFRDKFSSLMAIKLVIDTLNQKEIPFMMTYTDELLFDRRWNTTGAVELLQNFVQPHMTTFEEQSFLEWSRAHKFPISSTLHPLESAHRAAANYMIKIFDKQKTNNPLRQARV